MSLTYIYTPAFPQYFDENKLLTSSMNLGFFPLLFFFSFFYYTDVGSTFLVLFMYCLSLKGKNWMAGFIGESICSSRPNIVKQTNR